MDNDQRKSISLNTEQLKAFKQMAVRNRPYWDRVSIALAIRLLDTSNPYFNHFSVLNELDHLEGIRLATATKEEAPFKNPCLQPLWHKHFFLARNLPRNLVVRWNLEHGGNRDLTKLLDKIAKENGDNPDLWPSQLAHQLVIGGFEERAQLGLTGDWIIFAKHEGKNFYLDLATHEEGEDIRAVALAQRIRDSSAAEFPFIFE